MRVIVIKKLYSVKIENGLDLMVIYYELRDEMRPEFRAEDSAKVLNIDQRYWYHVLNNIGNLVLRFDHHLHHLVHD